MNIIFNLLGFFSSYLQDLANKRKTLQRCEEEGRNASASGLASDTNPYPIGSKESAAWESGHSNWIW
jgi:hypothetical protein